MNPLTNIKETLREIYDPFPYRRYQRKHKCIFIHIPKTAGTSILKAMGANPNRRDHLSYKVYEKASDKRFESYYKFAFVRNPWDRIYSAYKYLSSGGNGKKDQELKRYIDSKCSDFEGFVMDFLDHNVLYSHNMFKPQCFFICDAFGKVMVDYLGKFETIETDMTYILENIKVNKTIQKSNSSGGESYKRAYVNVDMIEKIKTLYLNDINKFDYSF